MSKPIDQELLPCPFCGGRKTEACHDHGIAWTRCKSCGATGPALTKYSGEEGEQCTDWNSRASVQPAGVAVPEGYVLVPIYPTPEMHDAGRKACGGGDVGNHVYTMMLAASSAAPHPVSVPESMRSAAAAEMNRLGYGHHESHAESILIAAGALRPVSGEQNEGAVHAISCRRFPANALAAPACRSDCKCATPNGNPCPGDGVGACKERPTPVRGEQKAVAVVDEGDDGQWAEILPDVSVRVGDKLYADPPAAQDVAGLVEALRTVVGLLQHKAETPLEKQAIQIANEAIAAHRDQQGEQP